MWAYSKRADRDTVLTPRKKVIWLQLTFVTIRHYYLLAGHYDGTQPCPHAEDL